MAEGGAVPMKEEEVPITTLSDLPLEDAVRQKLEASKELNILIVGCYQVGKSALINSLFYIKGEKYKKKAEEGSIRACTGDVTPFTLNTDAVTVNIYDSPGLQDKSNDLEYLRMIERACPNIHLIIYCKKMLEPIRPAEKAALLALHTAFGSSIWHNTIIALTFANFVDPTDPDIDEVEHFEKIKQDNVEEFEKVFKLFIINKKLVEKLKTCIYPVGSAKVLKLPGMADGEDWRGDFWIGCLEACKEEAKGAALKMAWRDPAFVSTVVKSSVASTVAGTAGAVGGGGCVIAGIVLTATGILAPVGITLIVGGAVGGLLGVGAAAGGAKGITSARKIKKELQQINKQENIN